MLKAYVLAGLAAVLPGCAVPTSAWKGEVAWPDEHSAKSIARPMEAGAALAAAAAIREMLRTNTDPGLFWGCSSPEQGLEVAVFTGPTSGLYYVVVEERFDRCSGPRGRVLDWWHVYAVTPRGEVVGKAPPPTGEFEDSAPTPAPVPPPALMVPLPLLPAPSQPPAPPTPATPAPN